MRSTHVSRSVQSWEHLKDVELADPQFGIPGRIDILLGIEVFASVLRQGWQSGTANSPIAFETDFGWVLAGTASPSAVSHATIIINHVSVNESNDTNEILWKFWEIEKSFSVDGPLTAEETIVANHLETSHTNIYRPYQTTSQLVSPVPWPSEDV